MKWHMEEAQTRRKPRKAIQKRPALYTIRDQKSAINISHQLRLLQFRISRLKNTTSTTRYEVEYLRKQRMDIARRLLDAKKRILVGTNLPPYTPVQILRDDFTPKLQYRKRHGRQTVQTRDITMSLPIAFI